MKTGINDLKKKFVENLSGVYPLEEVHSIFHWLTEAYLGLTRLQVALSPNREVNEEEYETFLSALDRLKDNEPIQHILGETEFFGITLKVDNRVLIPRPETEELVDWIISDLKKMNKKGLRILDIGTGSGCIAIALAKHLPDMKVSAMDISRDALEVATRNARLNNVSINFLEMNILEMKQLGSSYDVIVSNPPYVRRSEAMEMRNNVLQKEPAEALWVEDQSPLLFYEKITHLAINALTPAGSLYFEINEAFGEATHQLLSANNFHAIVKKDIFGKDRMAKGIFKKKVEIEN